MKTAAPWRAGTASDVGLQRDINEDRVWIDEERGIFLVVDGLGGHAAGEIAAAAAVEIIQQNLKTPDQIESVIWEANNHIYGLTEAQPQWRGMACVLTVAMLRGGELFIGHVGDTRLYLFWNGRLQKMTNDHSPVGEEEDGGLLTEDQAMRHPRRNEVYRDVGSVPRACEDALFIEIHRISFHDDAALLLCSDGLTDSIKSRDIVEILERYDGNASETAQLLIEAANAAGGKDNVSVIFVAGPAFAGADSRQLKEARARHAATRHRTAKRASKPAIFFIVLVTILIICIAAWLYIRNIQRPDPTKPIALVLPRDLVVNAENARGIVDALAIAASGDTIKVPPGDFLGPLVLKEGVNVVSTVPGTAIVRCDPSATIEPGVAIVAKDLRHAAITGLKLASDDTHPLKTGVFVVDSAIELKKLDISGAIFSGIRIEGHSSAQLIENLIHDNSGAGIAIEDFATPTLLRNQILRNGLTPNALKPGIEIGSNAHPLLDSNTESGNGRPGH